MRSQQKKELLQKGWREPEITRAEQILERSLHYDQHFSKIVFWSALVVIIFANLVVSLVLIPFLVVLTPWLLYALVVVLAATVGYLYNFLIRDIGHLQRKHHVWAGILVPLLALGNMVIMAGVSNKIILDLKLHTLPHNIWIVSGVFAVAFMVPYVGSMLFGDGGAQ